jgi:DNA gyrase inhibitor GyrI
MTISMASGFRSRGARPPYADAPPFEVYLNDPSEVPPEDLLTDIVVPLR